MGACGTSRCGAALVLALVAANVLCLSAAGMASLAWPSLLAPVILAWTFGLRHAVDADHIASIDNVTRNLMHRGTMPISVGFWFSMGHSTVVFIVCCAIAISAKAFEGNSILVSLGGVIGTCISAGFLFFIGSLNLAVLSDVLYKYYHPAEVGELSEERVNSPADLGSSDADVAVDEEAGGSGAGSGGAGSDAKEDSGDSEVLVLVPSASLREKPIPGPTGVLSRCCPALLNAVDRPYKVSHGRVMGCRKPLASGGLQQAPAACILD